MPIKLYRARFPWEPDGILHDFRANPDDIVTLPHGAGPVKIPRYLEVKWDDDGDWVETTSVNVCEDPGGRYSHFFHFDKRGMISTRSPPNGAEMLFVMRARRAGLCVGIYNPKEETLSVVGKKSSALSS